MSWNQLIDEGTRAVGRTDYAAAEKSLKLALQFAKENFERTDGRLALTLTMLGHVYFHSGDFMRAERLLEQSLRLHSEDSNLNDPCVLMDLFSLAEIKQSTGKRAEACRLYNETLQKIEPANPHDCKKIQEAAKTFRALAKKVESSLSERERECAISPLTSLATPSDALPVLQLERLHLEMEAANATNGGGDDSGPAPLPLPSLTREPSNNAGTLDEVWQQQFQTGLASMRLDEPECDELVTAYLNLESAYRLATSMFIPQDMRFIATVKALADACTKLRMFDDAEMLYRQAMEQSNNSKENAVAAANSLKLALGLMYVEAGQFKHAQSMLDQDELAALPPEASALKKRVEEALALLKVYNQAELFLSQASTAEEMGDLERASRLANNALAQFKQGFPPAHIENARILRYRSNLLSKLGQDDQSQDLLQRAERIERANEAKLAEWARIIEELPRVAHTAVPA